MATPKEDIFLAKLAELMTSISEIETREAKHLACLFTAMKFKEFVALNFNIEKMTDVMDERLRRKHDA